MRTTLKWARAGMAAVFFVATCVGDVHAADMSGKPGSQVGRDSVLRIPANAAFPLSKRIDLGVGRSIVVQFPMPLKDVLVSDPGVLDAVVQSSDRVFLIAKKAGQTNAFFFDEYGQQILTLEVAIGADLSSLDQLLTRLIPGSNIHSEIAGRAIVLTGSVRTPVDSNMAAQIAAQFAAVNKDAASVTAGPSATSNTSSSTTIGIGTGDSSFQEMSSKSGGGSGGGGEDVYAAKPIINLLSVEGEEQVMLRVSVAEVQRDMLKQFGINLGALVNSGNFTTAILGDNAFPLSAAAGLGVLPVPGITAGGLNVFDRYASRGHRIPERRGRHSLRQLGRRHRVAIGQSGHHRRSARPRARRSGQDPGRAQPDRCLWRAGKVPRRWRVPRPRHRQPWSGVCALQEVRHRSRLHAGRPFRGAHQLEDRDGGERALEPRRRHPQRHSDPCPQDTASQLDRRVAVGRLAGAGRPAVGGHAAEHRRLPGDEGSARSSARCSAARTTRRKKPSSS